MKVLVVLFVILGSSVGHAAEFVCDVWMKNEDYLTIPVAMNGNPEVVTVAEMGAASFRLMRTLDRRWAAGVYDRETNTRLSFFDGGAEPGPFELQGEAGDLPYVFACSPRFLR